MRSSTSTFLATVLLLLLISFPAAVLSQQQQHRQQLQKGFYQSIRHVKLSTTTTTTSSSSSSSSSTASVQHQHQHQQLEIQDQQQQQQHYKHNDFHRKLQQEEYNFDLALAITLLDPDEVPSQADAEELVRLTEIFYRRVLATRFGGFQSIDMTFQSLTTDSEEEDEDTVVIAFRTTVVFSDEDGPPSVTDVIDQMNEALTGRSGEAYLQNFASLAGGTFDDVDGAFFLAPTVSPAPSPSPAVADTVFAAIVERDELNTLEDAIIAAGLANALANEDGTFTVFAPTNTAFDLVPEPQKTRLFTNSDYKPHLISVLLYHVVAGQALFANDIFDADKSLTTLYNDETLQVVSTTTPQTINGNQVTTANINTENGVVHVINGVLTPSWFFRDVVDFVADNSTLSILEELVLLVGTDFVNELRTNTTTLFAPTNDAFNALPDGVLDDLRANVDTLEQVLKYHLLGGVFMSNELSIMDDDDDTDQLILNTVQGRSVVFTVDDDDTDTLQINGVDAFRETDYLMENGVVHVIDTVLTIPAITSAPSATPSEPPTAAPSIGPTKSPQPSATPSASPSAKPSATPSAKPSAEPSASPSAKPSAEPSASPSATTTISAMPSEMPTPIPAILRDMNFIVSRSEDVSLGILAQDDILTMEGAIAQLYADTYAASAVNEGLVSISAQFLEQRASTDFDTFTFAIGFIYDDMSNVKTFEEMEPLLENPVTPAWFQSAIVERIDYFEGISGFQVVATQFQNGEEYIPETALS